MTFDPPALVTVSERDIFLPTITLPKSRLVGLDERVPTEIPVPVNGSVRVALEAFERMLTVPVALPAAFGANETVNVVLWEGFSVRGVVIPLI